MKNFQLIRLCMMAIAIVCVWEPAWACSSAVISGKVTPDGRPLLWKNRETGHLRNHMVYVKGEKYDFVADVNSDNFPKLKEAWVGSNVAGFALMNTQSYNLVRGDIADDDRGPKNGDVIYRALEVCATVADFCHFLDTIQKPSGIEANFGVIDAQGGAAMFEVDEHSYKMFDANDPNVAPHGYVARTNFSNGGELNLGYGYVRYLEVDRVLSKACAMGGITPQLIFTDIARSFRNNILDIDLRSGDFNYPKTSGWFTDQDFIPRNNTSCSIVVQGVKKGENPELTVLWTILGYPPTGVAVPLWVKDNLPAMMSYNEELKAAPLSAASLKLADEKVFHFKQGGGTKHYLHWENLYNLKGTGIMQQLMPLEEKIYQEALPMQQQWYQKGKVDKKELDALYGRMENMLKSAGVF
ncbi:MAG: hypothetical protein IJA95_07600 [Bacteroidaceae bacterium]|nr:hypothetical protein [Bacteroidaceae bacterium]